MLKLLATALLYLLISIPASASDIVRKYIPDASKVGTGKLSVIFWDVYDATLYAPKGVWKTDWPFALSIHYVRTIDGKDIADRSAEEIRKIGYTNEVTLATWHSQMREIFPDVSPGTQLIGVYEPEGPTVFYHNSDKVGSIRDPEFGRWFFDIWLSEKTSEPELRSALLGR